MTNTNQPIDTSEYIYYIRKSIHPTIRSCNVKLMKPFEFNKNIASINPFSDNDNIWTVNNDLINEKYIWTGAVFGKIIKVTNANF